MHVNVYGVHIMCVCMHGNSVVMHFSVCMFLFTKQRHMGPPSRSRTFVVWETITVLQLLWHMLPLIVEVSWINVHPGVHHAFGHSTTYTPASSAMAGKYSWIGHALLGCHWLGWLMRPACGWVTDSRLPTNQLTVWADWEGWSWCHWIQSQIGFSWCCCLTQTFTHT